MKMCNNGYCFDALPFKFENELQESMSYEAYMTGIKKDLKTGDLPDKEINNGLLHYTRLNMHRMERWNKTLKLEEETLEAIKELKQPLMLLVITESWCGDAAHVLPVTQKILDANPLVSLRIVLRDENPQLMNEYLTNGNRSIPVVIGLAEFEEGYAELFRWGPKPSQLLEKLSAFKNGSLKISQEEFQTDTQKWYNQDKTKSVQKELVEKFRSAQLI